MGYQAKAQKAIMEIYKRQFKESNPSKDFDKIIESGEGKERDFFMKYYLPEDEQQRIIDDVCKEMKIPSWLRRQIGVEVTLGSSPTGNREAQKRHLQEGK